MTDKDRGYLKITLNSTNGKRHAIDLHLVICSTFHGERPSPEHEAAHHNGSRIDARAENLSWKTTRENNADMVRHGTRMYGERHHACKLTDAQVAEIKATYAAAGTRKSRYGLVRRLAARYDVAIGTIEDLVFTRVPRSHCPKGHPLSGDNIYTSPRGNRKECRICRRERAQHNTRAYLARKKAARTAAEAVQ
jgi:hypothetical protein